MTSCKALSTPEVGIQSLVLAQRSLPQIGRNYSSRSVSSTKVRKSLERWSESDPQNSQTGASEKSYEFRKIW